MSKEDNKNVDNDYQYSREVLFDLIEKGRGALEDMIEVARESEHPRAFEVLSGLMKNTADINDKLLDLNKKHKDINTDPLKQIENGTTNNNVYVGSTADLQRMLQDVKSAKENNVVDITPHLKDE
jgi:hypothetical protein|tara:strand:+ start:3755 stop:4129 length:375 start_codon:yes stop_codon:yes gene_type:complete